ncbi:MAG: hypothetical protein ABJA02_06225 [Acidobacteriota bacterium]
MKLLSRRLPQIAAALFTLVIGLTAASAYGQSKAKYGEYTDKHQEFCAENNWSNEGKVSSRDLRELTVASTGDVNVDAGRNGGVSIKGEDRQDVFIRACVQAWGSSAETAKTNAANIRIDTNGTIKAEGGEDNNSSVSYEIHVPRNSNVDLTAHNGGVSITSVDGKLGFETTNGGVYLSDVSGSVKGRTTNGGVSVKLAGTTWKGSGLEVTTSNGGVNLELPETYAARIETGTVNGGFKSSIPALNITTENIIGDEDSHHRRPTRISQAINGGGPTIRVTTTNGGVRISSPE